MNIFFTDLMTNNMNTNMANTFEPTRHYAGASTSPELQIMLDHPNAKVPTRGSAGAAGYDLYAAVDTKIKPGDHEIIQTGIRVRVPAGTYGRIAPRSGLAWLHAIDVMGGVVDSDYRGCVGVILFNHGLCPFEVKAGDRVAQLICEVIKVPDVVVVSDLDLAETIRGEGGFGSTGGAGNLSFRHSNLATGLPMRDLTPRPPFKDSKDQEQQTE